MTMFEELYAMALDTPLTMVLSADEKTGRLTIHVIPKPTDNNKEPLLGKPLSLTATPAEFDEGFVAALKKFRGNRQSLAEQVEATCNVLEAAKAAQSKKAGNAVSNAARPAATPTTAGKDETKVTEDRAKAEPDLFG